MSLLENFLIRQTISFAPLIFKLLVELYEQKLWDLRFSWLRKLPLPKLQEFTEIPKGSQFLQSKLQKYFLPFKSSTSVKYSKKPYPSL
jgi:hypothetical protein